MYIEFNQNDFVFSTKITFKDFANRLQGTVDKGFDEVYSLIDLCLGRDEQIL